MNLMNTMSLKPITYLFVNNLFSTKILTCDSRYSRTYLHIVFDNLMDDKIQSY